jgi:hypothetical protein
VNVSATCADADSFPAFTRAAISRAVSNPN